MKTNLNSLNYVDDLLQLADRTEKTRDFTLANLAYQELFQELCSGGLSFLHSRFGKEDALCIDFEKYANGTVNFEKIRRAKGILTAARKQLAYDFSDSSNGMLSLTESKLKQNSTKMIEVFVTYSWGDQVHEAKVVSFTDHLRRNGFKAVMDKMLIQENTALDFVEMMHTAMTQYDKVIIILSESYKRKAEAFSGGVGNEYSMILKSIKENPTKYILVSFEGISDSIIPLALKGREIVDMSNPESEVILKHKILNKKFYQFSDVVQVNHDLNIKSIPEFTYDKPAGGLEVVKLISRMTNGMSAENIYSFAVNEFYIEITNASSKAISDFVIEIRLPGSLAPRDYLHLNEIGFRSNGEYLIKSISVQSKLYPGQPYISEKFMVEVNRGNANKAKESNICINLFSEAGTKEYIFPLSEYFKVSGDYGQSNNLESTAFG